MQDDYPGADKAILASSDDWEEITPHDTDELPTLYKAIAVGGTGGPVVMKGKSGNAATFYFSAGEIKPLRPKIVMATGTSATPIYGLM